MIEIIAYVLITSLVCLYTGDKIGYSRGLRFGQILGAEKATEKWERQLK